MTSIYDSEVPSPLVGTLIAYGTSLAVTPVNVALVPLPTELWAVTPTVMASATVYLNEPKASTKVSIGIWHLRAAITGEVAPLHEALVDHVSPSLD